MWVPQGKTADGFETHFGTNFLGHFLLTSLLLDRLPDTAASRVVTLSSSAHRGYKLNLDDLQFEKSYSRVGAYRSSKLETLMFALELQRRLENAGRRVESVASHPGMSINTGLIQNQRLKRVLSILTRPLDNPPREAAKPTVYAAIAPDVRGGQYYGPTGFMKSKGEPGIDQPSAQALVRHNAEKLWAIADELTDAKWTI